MSLKQPAAELEDLEVQVMLLSRIQPHWRHFARSRRTPQIGKWRDRRLDQQHTIEPELVDYVCKSTDFFDCGEERVVAMMQRRPEIGDLERRIPKLRKRFESTHEPLDGLTALLAQVPRAVFAQLQMDKYPHGYRNKQERLFELIDFNDTLVSTILLLDNKHREEFGERTKQAADRVCKRIGVPCFTNEQWTAIVRGLTREVAVYSAARGAGFNAWLTDRAHDALGVDLQVQDPEDGRYINVDVKTPSSFRHRMEQLVHEKRLTERELVIGDQQSYVIEENGHGNSRVQIIVLCILPDLFGELTDWRFVNPEPMRQKLNQLIRDHGIHDGEYGKLLQ